MMNTAQEYVRNLHSMGFRSYDDLKANSYMMNKLLHYLFNRGDEQKNKWLVDSLFEEAEKPQSFDSWAEYGIKDIGEI